MRLRRQSPAESDSATVLQKLQRKSSGEIDQNNRLKSKNIWRVLKMKLGFNEATALECKGQSLMADLEMCEKYGFDYIEIRFDCVKDYLKEHTLEELADWFKNHHLKPWAYNTLIFFAGWRFCF
jgi:hypothetical protein